MALPIIYTTVPYAPILALRYFDLVRLHITTWMNSPVYAEHNGESVINDHKFYLCTEVHCFNFEKFINICSYMTKQLFKGAPVWKLYYSNSH